MTEQNILCFDYLRGLFPVMFCELPTQAMLAFKRTQKLGLLLQLLSWNIHCFRHLLVLSALSNARNSSSRSMRDWKSRVLCSNIIIASWKRRSRMFLYFLKSKDSMKVYFAFDDRFVRFTGVVYLIHNTTEIVEQKRPVTSSWVLRSSLNWLNNLKGFMAII